MQDTCGTCRQPLGNIRNRALEQLAACISLPCKFCDMGCDQSMTGVARERHERLCEFRPYGCPLEASCTFTGSKGELVEHLHTKHSVPTRTSFAKAVLQSSANFLEAGVARGVLFSAASDEEMLFMWSQTIHVLQACIVTFGEPHSHTYNLGVSARGRKISWDAPVRGIREPGGTIFKANDCLTIQQTLAGWFSDSPPESDELNITMDVALTPNMQEVADIDTTEIPPVMSQGAGSGGALNAVQTRLANIQDGTISGPLRRWIGGRGGWGRIELAVCEIIAASSNQNGLSRSEIQVRNTSTSWAAPQLDLRDVSMTDCACLLQTALGHHYTPVVLQNATDRLTENGWVYQTSDDDHFKMTSIDGGFSADAENDGSESSGPE